MLIGKIAEKAEKHIIAADICLLEEELRPAAQTIIVETRKNALRKDATEEQILDGLIACALCTREYSSTMLHVDVEHDRATLTERFAAIRKPASSDNSSNAAAGDGKSIGDDQTNTDGKPSSDATNISNVTPTHTPVAVVVKPKSTLSSTVKWVGITLTIGAITAAFIGSYWYSKKRNSQNRR